MFESNDTFIEEAVKSVETAQDKAKKTGLFALGFVCLGLSLYGIFSTITIIAAIVFFIAAIFAMGNKNIEFEYDYTNGSLSIAKIINNERRKELLSIESSQIRMVAAAGTNESLKYDHVKLKTYDCSAHNDNVKDYILVAHDDKSNQDFKVIFNPSENLINAMKRYNKRDIYE